MDFGVRILREIGAVQVADAVSIIVDGELLTHEGNIIYVKIDSVRQRETEVVYFTMVDKREEVIEGFGTELAHKLSNSGLGGVDTGLKYGSSYAHITVNPTLEALIIECGWYHKIHEMISSNSVRSGSYARIDGNVIPMDKIFRMRTVFLDNAWGSFLRLVFGKLSTRCVNRFWMSRSCCLYKMYKAFIPTFIRIKGIFNPLFDNPEIDIRKFDIYRTAEEKGRFVGDDNLGAFMLTHKEICEGFHMKNFVRFTPKFFYIMMAGFLTGGSVGYYPSTRVSIYVRKDTKNIRSVMSEAQYEELRVAAQKLMFESGDPELYHKFLYLVRYQKRNGTRTFDGEPQYGLSTIMPEAEYNSLLDDTMSALLLSCNKESREKYSNIVEEYDKMTTLRYQIEREKIPLTEIGSCQLDDAENTTVSKLYEYLSVARL